MWLLHLVTNGTEKTDGSPGEEGGVKLGNHKYILSASLPILSNNISVFGFLVFFFPLSGSGILCPRPN